jgi:lipopolysaccharide/colanic/teichoic acid biosynthesis glycosyltransferase
MEETPTEEGRMTSLMDYFVTRIIEFVYALIVLALFMAIFLACIGGVEMGTRWLVERLMGAGAE